MSYELSDLTTIADFAKNCGVTTVAVTSWIETYGFKPVATYGRTRLFVIKELQTAAVARGNGKAMLAMGYVHPEIHSEATKLITELQVQLKELDAHYSQLLDENNELSNEIEKLTEKLQDQHS